MKINGIDIKDLIKFGPYTREKIIREYKGESVIDFNNDYTIVDLETTGLDPEFCDIIEISALKYKNNELVDKFSTLVRLENENDVLDNFIINLTGITDDMLKDAPTLDESLIKFYDFIEDDLLLGYNVNFDINFLYDKLLEKHNIYLKNNFMDLLRLSRKLLPELNSHKLKIIADYYNLEEQKHRSESDCILCNEIYKIYRNKILDNYSSFENFKRDNFDKITKSYLDKKYIDNINSENNNFDKEHPLFNKHCTFTGTLENLSRKEAMQIVMSFGGRCDVGVTKKTNYLILGNFDFCCSIKEGKSSKQKKAEKLKLEGQDIEIISENVFYDMIEK